MLWGMNGTTPAAQSLSATARPTRWEGDGLVLDTDFPGGNLQVEAIADGVVRVRQEQRDSPQWWFHWSFRIRGAAGRQIAVRFTDGEAVGVRGPALSSDDGRSWSWQEAQAGPRRAAFDIALPATGSLRLAFGIPHELADWTAFTAAQPALRPDVLCRTRHGREVPLARVGGATAAHLVLLTARHHCCEAMAGWALAGFARAVLADPAWAARAEVIFVPFVDLDGSEEGDQGKGRRPRDHGRDYAGTSIYPETAAIRAAYAGWAAGRPSAVIDLHCPWISGQYNQHIYQVGAAGDAWAQQRRLAGLLEACRRGPLPYRADGDLPFGQAWNVTTNYSEGRGIRGWAAEQPGCRLATTFEIPYADASGTAVLPEGARAFGADLASALAAYLDG